MLARPPACLFMTHSRPRTNSRSAAFEI